MKKIFSNIWFHIQFEIDEMRYSTAAPLALLVIPIAIWSVGLVVYSFIGTFF